MKRPSLALRCICVAALALGLAGCELLVMGTGAGLVMAYVRGEGIRKYEIPFEEVVAAAEKAADALNLMDQSISRGARRTTITGRDVDGNRVRIRVIPLDGGRAAEVRVRIGLLGEYVPTKVFVDTLNEQLGLPPEPEPVRAG